MGYVQNRYEKILRAYNNYFTDCGYLICAAPNYSLIKRKNRRGNVVKFYSARISVPKFIRAATYPY